MGLSAVEPLESRAMLAITPVFAANVLTLQYAGAGNEGILELYENATTKGQVDAFFLDANSGVSSTYANVLSLNADATADPTNDVLTLQTTQGKTGFQIVGVDLATSKISGIWEGPTAGFLGMKLEGLESIRVRTPSTVAVSGQFKAGVEVTAGTINAGVDSSVALQAPSLSLTSSQINVGNLGILANGPLTLSSTTSLTVSSVAGNISANKGSISVVALGDINLGPSISLSAVGGTLTANSATGSLAIGGKVTADGNISLGARTGTTVIADVTSASGNVTVVDLSDVVLGGAVTATAGAVDVTSQVGSIQVVGGVTSDTGINLIAGTTIDALLLLTTGLGAGSPITLTSSGATTIVGGVTTVGSNASIVAGGALSVGAAINLGAGSLTLNGTDVALSVPATVTAAKVDVLATGTATLGGQVTATGAVGVTASGNVSLAGVQDSASLSLTSQSGSVTSTGAVKVTGGAATINAATLASINGTVTADSVAVTAGGAVLAGGAVTSKVGDVSLASTGSSVTVDGSIDSKDSVTINANTAAIVNGSVTGEEVSISGIQSATVAGGVTGTLGNVKITSVSGAVNVTGLLDTKLGTGKVEVSAATDAAVGGGITTNKSAATITASTGKVSLSGAIAVGDAIFTAVSGGDLTTTVSSTVDAGTIDVTSGGKASFGGSLTATENDITVKSGDDITLTGGATTTVGDVSLTSSGGDIAVAGVISAADLVTLQSNAGGIDVTGNIDAVSAIAVTGLGKVRTAGTVTSTGGNVLLTSTTLSVDAGAITADNGSIRIKAVDTAGGKVDVSGGTGVAVSGAVESTNDGVSIVSATGDANVAGTLKAKTDISVTANQGNIGTVALTSSTGKVSVEAGKVATLAGAVLAATATKVTATTLSTLATSTITADSIDVRASDTLTLNGDATATGVDGIVVRGTNAVTVNALLNAVAGPIDVSSKADALTVNGALSSAGNLKASGAKVTTLNGPLTVGGNATLGSSTDALTVNGAVTVVGSLTASAAGNLSVSGAVAASEVIAGSGVDLSVGGTVVSGGKIDLTAGQNLTAATLTSSGPITIQAGITKSGDVALSGAVTTNAGALSVTAGSSPTIIGSVAIVGGVTTSGGDVTVTSNGAGKSTTVSNIAAGTGKVQLTGVTVTTGVGGSVTGGSIFASAEDAVAIQGSLAAIQSLVSTGAISVNAVNAATVLGSITGTKVDVAAASTSVSGSVTATTETVTLQANGGDLTISNPVTATGVAGGIMLQATKNVSAVDLKTTAGGILVRSGADPSTNGSISLTGSVATTTGNIDLKAGSSKFTGAIGSIAVAGAVTSDSGNFDANSIGAGQGVSITSVAVNAGDVTISGDQVDLVVNGSVGGKVIKIGGSSSGTISGSVTGTGDVTVSSNGPLTLAGAVQGTSVTTTSGGALTASGAITATAGAATVQAGTSLSVIQTIKAGTTITVIASNSVSASSLVSESNGLILVRSGLSITGGSIVLSGTVKTDGDVDVQAGVDGTTGQVGTVSVAGAISTANGAVTLKSFGANQSVSVADIAAGTGTITITGAQGGDVSLIVNGLISGGSITASAENLMTVGATVTGAGDVKISGGNGLNTSATVTSTTGLVRLASGAGAVTLANAVTAGKNIDIQAATNFSSAVAITSGTSGAAISKDITITSGTVAAGGNVSLAGAVTTNGGKFDVVTATQFDSVGTISVGSTVTTSGGDVLLQAGQLGKATSGTVSINSTITAGTGNVTSRSDIFNLSAGSKVSGGTIGLNANDTATVNGTITGTGPVTLQAVNVVAVNGAISSSGGAISVQSVEADLTVTQPIKASGDVTLSGGTTATVTNVVTAGGNIDIRGGTGAVSIRDNVTSTGGGVSISSSFSTIDITDAVTANGLLSVAADGAVTITPNAPLLSNAGSIGVSSATAGIVLNAYLKAQQNIVIDAPGNISTATGATLNAIAGDLFIGNTDLPATLTLNASATSGAKMDLHSNGAFHAKSNAPLIAGASLKVTSQNGTIDLDNTANAVADLTLRASGALTTATKAPLDAGGNLFINSVNSKIKIGDSATSKGGDLTIDALLDVDTSIDAALLTLDDTAGNVTIVSQTATVALNASIKAAGYIDGRASSALTTSNIAPFDAKGTILLISKTSSLTIRTDLSAGGEAGKTGPDVEATIDLRAATSITLEGSSPLTATAGGVAMTAQAGLIRLDADSAVTSGGDIKIVASGATGTITLSTGSDLNSTADSVTIVAEAATVINSNITAGDEITVTGSNPSGSVTTAGAFKAVNDITVTSNSGSLDLAALESTAGSISLSGNGAGAAGTVNVGSAKADAGDVSISGNGAVTTGAVAGLGESVAISGGGDVTTGDTTAGSAVTISSGTGKVSLNGSVGTTDKADGTVALTAVKGISQAPSMAITTGVLSAINTGSGDITLDSTANSLGDVNAVGAFAAKNTVAGGNVTFFHIGNLEIGSGEIDGISVNGGDIIVRQNTTGDIYITQPILTNSAANTITLESFGEIRDSDQGRVASARLVVRNLGGSGDILLDSPLNDADTIAIRNFATGFDILYLDATDITVGIAGQGVRTDFGDITLKAGTSITAAAELYAGQSTQLLPATVGTTIALIASSGITQTASQIVGNNLSVNNVTGAITLASLSNDIEQFAAVNTGGPVTYNDVNDFETGVTRTEAGLPLGYEVQTSGDLTLRAGAAGTPSTLRVVSGLRYGALTLTAGDSNTGAVGIVEYVTTSEGDNPPAPGSRGGFAGTLRDMITYANENKGRQTINGVAAVQPQLATFDELYYSVTDIVLSAGLPTIVQALSIDGERVEAQVTDYARVGISGSKIVSNSVVNGLSYGPGSGGSRVNGLALYGFRTGAGISLASGVNTVTNTFAGLQRDGTVDQGQRNLVGIDVTGRLATKNVIGNIITDDTTANVIGGNTFAGIVVRGGASSNAIVGNLIGTSAADDDVRNLGDGIRIDGSNTNTIGTRNSQRPDLTAALSNTIKYNGGSGIRITGAMAATRALGNAIENNLIDENGAHGIHIVSSAAQTVGGSLFNQANIIGNHIAVTPTPSGVTGAGIYLQSTAGSVITGNKIGVGSNFEAIGNSVGIRLQASTGNTINDGNQIGNNLGNGIELLQGSNANRVEGNYIGATINENTDLDVSSNGGGGILIQQSLANLVQGANLIANNAGTGISVVDSAAKNLQQGNFIGGNTVTNNGTASKGTAGILILGGGYQTIGGDAGGNTISLNNGDGIRVSNGSLTGASVGNVFTGNFVGTNKFHEDLLGNTGYGISITNGSKHVIAGNAVLNNGIDPTNESGTIEYDGIRIAGSSSNTVGSTLIGGGNIVGGNGGNGIVITDAVDVAGFGQVRIVANVARFTRAQTGKLRLNDVIVVDTSAYKITLIKNATTMNVTPVDGGPSDVALVDFQIRTAVANANNVVYGNSVADNTGNGIVVSGLRTNIVTVGQITIRRRAQRPGRQRRLRRVGERHSRRDDPGQFDR